MFRTLIHQSLGACDYSVELPHWSYCSWFDVCSSFGVKHSFSLQHRYNSNPTTPKLQHTSNQEQYNQCRTTCASACNTDTTPTQPHRNSNTHRTKNNTTNVVIQQNSRKLLMMDILMSETCLSLQHGYHSNPTTPKLQHTPNQEQYSQCGNSTE